MLDNTIEIFAVFGDKVVFWQFKKFLIPRK